MQSNIIKKQFIQQKGSVLTENYDRWGGHTTVPGNCECNYKYVEKSNNMPKSEKVEVPALSIDEYWPTSCIDISII